MTPEEAQALFTELGQKYGIDPLRLKAVLLHESGGDWNAKGEVIKEGPDKGQQALGGFQLMPETAKAYGVDPLDPRASSEAAAKYLAESFNRTKNWDATVKEYFGGADKSRHGPKTRAYLTKHNEILAKLRGGDVVVPSASPVIPVEQAELDQPAGAGTPGKLQSRMGGLTAAFAAEAPAAPTAGLRSRMEGLSASTKDAVGQTGVQARMGGTAKPTVPIAAPADLREPVPQDDPNTQFTVGTIGNETPAGWMRGPGATNALVRGLTVGQERGPRAALEVAPFMRDYYSKPLGARLGNALWGMMSPEGQRSYEKSRPEVRDVQASLDMVNEAYRQRLLENDQRYAEYAAAYPEATIGLEVLGSLPTVTAGTALGGAGLGRAAAAFAPQATAAIENAMLAKGFVGRGANALTAAAEGAIGGGISAGMNEDSTGKNMLMGGAFGGPLGAVIRRVPARPSLAEVAHWADLRAKGELAQWALDKGIPVPGLNVTENKFFRNLGAFTSQMPFSPAKVSEAGARAGFTRQVAKQMGTESDKITPEVMQATRLRLSNAYDEILDKIGNVKFTEGEITEFNKILNEIPEANKGLFNRFYTELNENVDEFGNVSAKHLKEMYRHNGPLGILTENADPNIRIPADKLDDFLRSVLDRNDPEGFVRKINSQYKAMKAIDKLPAPSSIGRVDPKSLDAAVTATYKDRPYTATDNDLHKLAQVGREFFPGESAMGGTRISAQTVGVLGGTGGALATMAVVNPAQVGAVLASASGLVGGSYAINKYLHSDYFRNNLVNAMRKAGTPPSEFQNIMRELTLPLMISTETSARGHNK